MTDHSDLVERLEALGAQRPAGLTDARRNAIEARVLEAPVIGADPARRRPVVFMLAAAAAIIAVVLGFAVLRPADRGLVVSAADRVVLELADGTSTRAEAGDELADGTVIEIAAGGSLVLGDGVLGPGRYEVRDGRAVPVGPVPATSTTTTVARPPADDRSTDAPRRPATPDSRDLAPRPTRRDQQPPTTIDFDRRVPSTTVRTTTTALDRPVNTSTTVPATTPPTTTPPTRPPTTAIDPTTTTTTTTRTTTTTTVPSRDRPVDRPTTTVGDGGDREE